MIYQDMQVLYDYHFWANARILQATDHLSHEQFGAPADYPHGGVRSTLVHAMSAEWMWRMRCQERVSPASMLSAEDFPTVAHLRARWREEEDAMRAFLATLTDDAMAHAVEYTNTKGKTFTNTLWHILTHVVLHGMQHRSEVAAMVTGYGASPGDIDFLVFLRQS